MIFRAIFWIAVVSVLMPHEPDLGFGRPHMGEALPSKLSTLVAQTSTDAAQSCSADNKACTAGLALLDSFQSVAVRSLADVKADLDQSQQNSEQSKREDFIRRHSM
jgi:hypothetical protein